LAENEQTMQVRLCYLVFENILELDIIEIRMLSGEVKMPSIDDEYKKMETMLIMTPEDN